MYNYKMYMYDVQNIYFTDLKCVKENCAAKSRALSDLQKRYFHITCNVCIHVTSILVYVLYYCMSLSSSAFVSFLSSC